MKVRVNGKDRQVASGRSLQALLAELGITETRGVAVAVAGQVVPRAEWERTLISEGQWIEVLRAVQGG